MADILVYALHYEGAFNKNSLGAVSEGTKLASAIGDVGIEAGRVGEDGSRVACGEFKSPPEKAGGTIIEDEDTNETVEKILAWLDERKLI